MKSVNRFSPVQTVGEVLSQYPSTFQVFQKLQEQTTTGGICYITREDSLRELARRFEISPGRVIHELREFIAGDR